MGRFLLRRLLLAVPTLFGVTVVVFITIKIIPGNPVANLAGVNSTPAIRAALAHRLGLDSPFPIQYFDWLRSSLAGDFGISISRQTPVRPLVVSAFGNTMILAAAGALVAVIGGVAFGSLGALLGRRRLGHAVEAVSVVSISAPQYSVALLLLVVFSVDHPILPSGGMYDATGGGGFGVLLRHLILPGIAAGIAPMGIVARMFRATLSDVLGQEFVTNLRSRGLSRTAVLRHAIHNTMPSLLTIAGLQIGFLLGGVIFIETIFTWPGIGQLVYQAISSRDYPVIEACSLVIAVAFVLVNLLVDAGHAFIDPRVR
jgi:peptide/nickel transport system permease protein